MLRRLFLSVIICTFTTAPALLAAGTGVFDAGTAGFNAGSGARRCLSLVFPTDAGSPEHPSFTSSRNVSASIPPGYTLLPVQTSRVPLSVPDFLNDSVPKDHRVQIEKLADFDEAVVLIVQSGSDSSIQLCVGAGGTTAPGWLVEKLVSLFSEEAIPLSFEETSLPVYRLGWIDGDPDLKPYLEAGIPAIALRTNLDIGRIIGRLAQDLSNGIPAENDRFYQIVKTDGSWRILEETTLVFGIVGISALFLFILFMFGFVFGKHRDRHRRDTARFWWMPVVYLVLDIACLLLAQRLVLFLFEYRFAEAEAIRYLPVQALLAKIVFTLFFVSLFESFNQLIRFPPDSFIYGYMASVVCLINVFIFSSVDFSLAPIFLAVYAISFIFYHLHHPVTQVLAIPASVIPYVHTVRIVFNEGEHTLASLTDSSLPVTILLAFLLLPVQLLFLRLLHSIGIFGKRKKRFIPFNLVAIFIIASAAPVYLLFTPAWSAEKPLAVQLTERLTDAGSSLETDIPPSMSTLEPTYSEALAAFPSIPQKPESFIRVSIESRPFLDRRLITLTAGSLVEPVRIRLTVAASQGIAVFDASEPFELASGGQSAIFMSDLFPGSVLEYQFSSSDDPELAATVTVWSLDNPKGLTVTGIHVQCSYLLEVDRSFSIPLSGTAGDPL